MASSRVLQRASFATSARWLGTGGHGLYTPALQGAQSVCIAMLRQQIGKAGRRASQEEEGLPRLNSMSGSKPANCIQRAFAAERRILEEPCRLRSMRLRTVAPLIVIGCSMQLREYSLRRGLYSKPFESNSHRDRCASCFGSMTARVPFCGRNQCLRMRRNAFKLGLGAAARCAQMQTAPCVRCASTRAQSQLIHSLDSLSS